MATANPISESTAQSVRPAAGLLVLLAGISPDQLERVLDNLTSSFPTEELIVASPDGLSNAVASGYHPSLQFVAAPATSASWTLTADDFVNAAQLAEKYHARAILMLGPGAGTVRSSGLLSLADSILTTQTDLAVAFYDMPPHAGLVNSAILYPLTRALFDSRIRFPLAVDLCLSPRMAERMAGTAYRFTQNNLGESPLWPLNEAAVARFTVDQFDVGPRNQSQSAGPDLNVILPLVTGALFSDIEAKAAFWQRFRSLPPAGDFPPSQIPQPSADAAAEIAPMLQAFRLAHTNLEEVWSLVLPPYTLLGLKRLAAAESAAFRMPDSLWARIVYDFLLAYRLRTINRGHLLGALIPLYLGWVASHINITSSGLSAESHIESVATAFETEKTYLVSRWRWPDRFNP